MKSVSWKVLAMVNVTVVFGSIYQGHGHQPATFPSTLALGFVLGLLPSMCHCPGIYVSSKM